jgi:hypothetical protein
MGVAIAGQVHHQTAVMHSRLLQGSKLSLFWQYVSASHWMLLMAIASLSKTQHHMDWAPFGLMAHAG